MPTTSLLGFSVKPFLKRVVITPIGFEDKFLKFKSCQGFSIKPFLKDLHHFEPLIKFFPGRLQNSGEYFS
jgi:hypothetical protein